MLQTRACSHKTASTCSCSKATRPRQHNRKTGPCQHVRLLIQCYYRAETHAPPVSGSACSGCSMVLQRCCRAGPAGSCRLAPMSLNTQEVSAVKTGLGRGRGSRARPGEPAGQCPAAAAELQAVQALIGSIHLRLPVAGLCTAPQSHRLLLGPQLCQLLIGTPHLQVSVWSEPC